MVGVERSNVKISTSSQCFLQIIIRNGASHLMYKITTQNISGKKGVTLTVTGIYALGKGKLGQA